MKKAVVCAILALLIVVSTVAASFMLRFNRDGDEPNELLTRIEGSISWYLDNELSLTLSEDGTSYISWYGYCRDENAIIPESFNGKPITAVINCDFDKKTKTITLPNTITRFGATLPENLQYNEYKGVNYLGNEENPYLVAVSLIEARVFELSLHPDTRVIADNAFSSRQLLQSAALPSGLEYIGANAFSGCSTLEEIKLPRSLKVIGDGAFSGCSSLTSINLPAGLLEIGVQAFSICSKLTSVKIPDGIKVIEDGVFSRCISLTGISFGKNVEKIASSAFYCCSSLAGIKIPDSVTEIHQSAFSLCSNLKQVILPENLEYLHTDAFADCESLDYNEYRDYLYIGTEKNPYYYLVGIDKFAYRSVLTLHPNTEAIADSFLSYGFGSVNVSDYSKYYYMDGGCLIDNRTMTLVTALEDFSIPDGIKRIGDYAFFGKYMLSEVVLPDSVVSIGYKSFASCDQLISADLGNVTEIGEYAFRHCGSLQSVTHNSKLEAIGEYAFAHCTQLSSFEFPETLKAIGDYAFTVCGLEEVHIPASVDEIPTSAFSNSVSLRKVTLDGVEYIGENAFSHCSRLTEVVLPDSLTVIGRYAFSYSGITEITLPRNLLCIGNGAFSNCSKLTNVCVLRVVYIGYYAFASAPDSSYTLPSSLKYIGADAFMRRGGVEYTVDFAGTKAEWENIKKYGNWYAPTVVRCTDGDIVEQQDEE